jgi:signal transduction histidine kinase
MPFFVGDQPLFLIHASSHRQFARSRYSDINFIRSVGVILRANIVQARVHDADLAKTAFLSSISHELRTPMHGILSGLQLVREAVDASDPESAKNTLSVMDASGYALQRILDDVLDFGSWDKGTGEAHRRTKSDISRAMLAVVTTCLPRQSTGKVDVVIEMEERDWSADFDEAGFQR